MCEMTDITKELDLKGLNCPLPILRIKQTMARMESGEVLKIVGTEPGTERELKVLCKQGGHELLDCQKTPKEFIYTVRKG
jgi:tRNA 2-thiouridine synthesizing protein A